MPSNPPDQSSSKPTGLQSMLARLKGMVHAVKTPESDAREEGLPSFESLPAAESAPVEAPQPALGAATSPASNLTCQLCGAPRKDGQSHCDDCGYIFPPDGAPAANSAPLANASGRIKGRYELGMLITERGGVARYRGLDHGAGAPTPQAVVIIRMACVPPAEEVPPMEEIPPSAEGIPAEAFLSFDLATAAPLVLGDGASPEWPSVAWEIDLLNKAQHEALPAVVDTFSENSFDYLIEEVPSGQSLWDAWDAVDATAEKRFALLKQVAEGLHSLHQTGAILEGLRPDHVTITPTGQAKLNDLSDLLPLPLPADAPIRATLYTAPELLASGGNVDARADLYSFGAMLFSLHVGRELTDKDFEKQGAGNPRPFIPFFADIHPLFGRLVTKTFCKDPNLRFPTDEASKIDPTGFTELIKVLDVCRRTLDDVHLEVAAWTTTGMVRTGNEDAFALVHSAESRQDDLGESALLLLCDGMGGYEAGEVAAALAIQTLRKNLVQQKPFRALAGDARFSIDGQGQDDNPPVNIEEAKKLILAALKDANKTVFTASRSGVGRRGMGCTAEVVYVDSRNIVVGHVGDSRTYHLHEGNLIQLTRDQTLVNRLVELGTLSPEEAETHPRRNELQQAIGGQPEVEPGLYHSSLKAGDWVLVCSDGLTNHVTAEMLEEMLRLEAISADMAARRLVNLVNLHGATDNATVVVIRAT